MSSETPTVPGPLPSGSRTEEDEKQQQQQQQQQQSSTTEQPASTAEHPVTDTTAAPRSWNISSSSKRPLPWHQSPLIEPRPEPTQSRSIGVHAILNPLESGVPSRQSSREALEIPPSMSPSPQQRSSSSPLTRLSNPSTQFVQADSPGIVHRRIITPVSPSARFAQTAGKPNQPPGKIPVSQSPFVQEPSTGIYNVSSSVPLPIEMSHSPNLALSGRILPPHPSRHSTPTFHSRRLSVGLGTNPSSQNTSPSTPHSTYSQFGQSSPSLGPGLLQPPGPSSVEPQPLFPTVDSLNRAPSRIGGLRYSGAEDPSVPGPAPDVPPFQGMIPLVIDMKSGSRSQAEKRKANSDASRRFRNRKKNEMAMEQKMNAQTEEIRLLREERDYYRAEREFFRDLSRSMGVGPLPARPPSPRHFHKPLGQTQSEGAKEGVSHSAGSSPSMSAAGASHPNMLPHPHITSHPSSAAGGNVADPSAYLTPSVSGGQRIGRDEGQLQPGPPYPGPWPAGPTSGDVGGGQLPQTQGAYRPSDPQLPRDSWGRSWSRP